MTRNDQHRGRTSQLQPFPTLIALIAVLFIALLSWNNPTEWAEPYMPWILVPVTLIQAWIAIEFAHMVGGYRSPTTGVVSDGE